MKLTKSQIKYLYTFTQKHYVDWYDVQTELVDHLANGIEAQWEENSDLSFNEALDVEFKKFGIMGFGDVIEEKTKALNKRYRKLVWKYFLDYFKLPKIMFTLFLVYIYYLSLKTIENTLIVVVPICLVFLVVPIWFMIQKQKQIKKLKRETGKKWLFDNIGMQLGGLIHFFNIGIYASVIFDLDRTLPNLILFFISAFLVLFGLTLYISIFIVSPKLRMTMAKQHPEYKLA
ncbi:hypothetical protein [Winogradskyella ursingii]|uniref:hypothetical protein n=1 Tax=Winogradskyella ursingii TaxID=2686079 RepID=UPI0015CA5196|nr:hypothetical protein [Winogradskyella ursingii]